MGYHFKIGIIIFFCIFILFSQLSLAQNQPKADSAKLLLEEDPEGEELLKLLSIISGEATNPDVKLKYAKKLINEATRQDNYRKIISGYTDLGYAYKLKGQYQNALKSYLKAASMANDRNDQIVEADIYTNIAGIYNASENYDRSLEYYQRALRLYGDNADSVRVSGIYINYGYAAYKAQLYDSSIKFSKKAINYARGGSAGILRAYGRANLALALAKKGDLKTAEDHFEKAVQYMVNSNDNYGLSDCLIEIGSIYLENDRIEEAIEKLRQGYQIAKENGLKEQIKNALKYLAEAYKEQVNIEKAFDYQSRYYTYRDSLINAEQIRKLADLRTDYEVGQKQAEVDLLTAEKRTQLIIIYATVFGGLFVAILLALVYRNYREKNRINQILEDQKCQLERLNETKDKFFSIISHDLRGPVSAFAGISRLIKHAVEEKNIEEIIVIADEIDQTVDNLSGLLDNLLNWAMQQQGHFPNVPERLDLNELVEQVEGIFNNMARSKKIRLYHEMDQNIEVWADHNMVMTILRNLVNNALKFTQEGGTVIIIAQEKDQSAEIIVRDTGIGMPKDKLKRLFHLQDKTSVYGTGEKGLGLGLQLVYEFVEANQGKIKVSSEAGKGTSFTVYLPLFETISEKVRS